MHCKLIDSQGFMFLTCFIYLPDFSPVLSLKDINSNMPEEKHSSTRSFYFVSSYV